MKTPPFWYKGTPNLLAQLLRPFGAVYGALTLRHMRAARSDCGVPVICIGNYTAGGAGKTPLCLHVAQLLLAQGARVVFVSRGYGGAQRGPLLVDPARHGAAEVGDEPLLLARIAPVIVAANRLAGVVAAKALGASVIILDDGLQGGKLRHTLALCVIDGGVGLGNGLCVPAGPLRAPLAGQLPYVSAEVVIGSGAVLPDSILPRFDAWLVPDTAAAGGLKNRRVLAFAGIGRPEKFFATLENAGAVVEQRRAFGDHHVYAANELEGLAAEAQRLSLQLVTTEKDYVRLPSGWCATHSVLSLPVRMQFAEAEAFAALVSSTLTPTRSGFGSQQ